MPIFSPHSAQTEAIVAVFRLVLWIAAAVFLLVASGVIYCIIRYRGRGRTEEPRQLFGSRTLEILWTVIPVLVLSALFLITVRAMVFIDAPGDGGRAPDLAVTGHQWWWDARYPDGVVTTGDIHIPAGRRLLVQVESSDVVHDFWVPQLARKMDAVPGRWSYIWLEADRPGTYNGMCSEFCGAQHAWMRFRVIAEPEESFEAWLRLQGEAPVPAAGIAVEGEALFRSKKCADCHAVAASGAITVKGPSLAHLASREFLGGGIARNTPEALALWLLNPQAAKPGNRMPDTPLNAQERDALLAYLESLR